MKEAASRIGQGKPPDQTGGSDGKQRSETQQAHLWSTIQE